MLETVHLPAVIKDNPYGNGLISSLPGHNLASPYHSGNITGARLPPFAAVYHNLRTASSFPGSVGTQHGYQC